MPPSLFNRHFLKGTGVLPPPLPSSRKVPCLPREAWPVPVWRPGPGEKSEGKQESRAWLAYIDTPYWSIGFLLYALELQVPLTCYGESWFQTRNYCYKVFLDLNYVHVCLMLMLHTRACKVIPLRDTHWSSCCLLVCLLVCLFSTSSCPRWGTLFCLSSSANLNPTSAQIYPETIKNQISPFFFLITVNYCLETNSLVLWKWNY